MAGGRFASAAETWLWAVFGLFVLGPGCGLMVVFAFRLLAPSCGVYFGLLVCVGCARMWVVGCCLSGVFWFGLMPLLLFFRGDVVRFFFFLVFFWLAFVS